MRFSSSKYTKMCLRPGPHWGDYSAPQTPSSWWGRELAATHPKTPPPALGPAGLEFSALGLKEVVHPCSS